MSQPDFSRGMVGSAKILDYLLSPTHPAGRSKARFFERAGFARSQWQLLEQALLRHAASQAVVAAEQTEFGVKYTIEGLLDTPQDVRANVRTIWIVDSESAVPRLVTAYPL